ncbi:MAG: TIGR03016 family PEP-CTERM system-associated outer membrane protein, partial [Pseudomonadota bacterium]|nr:TIGR03016 family PEP-CTERM system-associated outer membrane protein [Pseudomonadota bacterium]
DDIIVRKSSNFQIGYDFSRVTLGMSWRYSEDDALDQDRLTRTYSFGTTLAYKIGSYSELNANVNYANIEQRSDTLDSGESENWNATLGFTRKIGRNLSASANFSYIDRSGDLINATSAGNGFFGSDFTDRKLSVSITYTYQ